MTRQGRTWNSYARLIAAASKRYGGALTLGAESQALEEDWLGRLSTELRPGSPVREEVQTLLAEQEIGVSHFRCHLRYIARWGRDRRRLLMTGGNFQLLEGLGAQDQAGQLKGLHLSGPLLTQKRTLAAWLNQDKETPQGLGWLEPAPNPGRPARLYDARDVAWVYPSNDVDFQEGLHPSVARSLIARYVSSPGVVADPMAGGGTVPVIATELGHWAWASDIAPQRPYIRPLDLLDEQQDLGKILGEEYQTAADLLVLHPPLPATLQLSLSRYTDWLRNILKNCWGAVKAGGHVALIVPVTADIPVLARAERALRDAASEEYGQDVEELAAMHLAVARNGSEGWHILVYRTPAIDETGTGK